MMEQASFSPCPIRQPAGLPPPQGALLHVLAVQAADTVMLLPYEASGEPFRLLAGFDGGTLAIVEPEAGAVLFRMREEVNKRHHTFETEDGRLILALSSHGGLMVLYDLGEAPSSGATMLPAANKLG
jgi:hypothetical protein